MVTPNCFLSGARCPNCFQNKLKTTEEFKQELYTLVGNEYGVLGEYIGANKKILLIHYLCGHKYSSTPHNFLNGNRCPICYCPNFDRDTKSFTAELYSLVKDEYTILGEYINSKTKILIRHNSCNHKYFVSPNNFLQGRRCPNCYESKGEQSVRHWLEVNNIKFEPQYKFDDLLSDKGNPLKFDFAIINNDGDLNYLIEYDGIFHFSKQYNDDGFEILKRNDNLKTNYCSKNNISLLRIPYWDFDNIDKILEDFILNQIVI